MDRDTDGQKREQARIDPERQRNIQKDQPERFAARIIRSGRPQLPKHKRHMPRGPSAGHIQAVKPPIAAPTLEQAHCYPIVDQQTHETETS